MLQRGVGSGAASEGTGGHWLPASPGGEPGLG